MAAIISRQDLIDYCLRNLGSPVLEINVDEDQIEDRVDEALQYFQAYHSDAVIKTYAKHQITSTDVTNRYITLTDQIGYITRIMPLTDNTSSINMFDAKYQMMLNDMFGLNMMGSLQNYAQMQQYLGLLNMMLEGTPQVRYNRHQDRLHLDVDWESDIAVGDYIVVECYAIVDPTQFSQVYNDMWLKRYLTALIKRQWGSNLIKFEGMVLPGGVQLNGRQMFDDANNEIQALEEEVRLNFEMPVDMFVG